MRRLLTLLLLLVATVVSGQESARLPPPDVAAQQAMSKTVSEAYKADYDAARTPGQKIALAKKLMSEAASTKDETGRFVMIRIGRNMAVQQGDLETAFQAIESLAARYEIDELQYKLNAVTDASLKTAPAKTGALGPITSLIDEALAADRHDMSLTAANKARDLARDARNSAEVKRFASRIKEIEQAQQALKQVQGPLETLRTLPEDPEANYAVGWYLCIQKANWQEGLPKLAKGSNDAVKQLAAEELGEKPDPLKLADAWWALAQSQEPIAKERLQNHAAQWYRLAVKSASGLEKAKIEMRLEGRSVDLPLVAGKPGRAAGLDATQQAALQWLAAHQLPDGGWSFEHGVACRGKCGNPGSMADARAAATALALLALLHSDQTHRDGEHKAAVDKGLKYLATQATPVRGAASFYKGPGTMYAHGLAALALCTAYARSKDEKLKALAQSSLAFTMSAQDQAGGGWRYAPNQAGDTSVTGWQVSGLVLGRDAGLRVPDATLKLAGVFLDSVASDGGSKYGYTAPGAGPATTASGLLARMNLGWKDDDPALQRGLKFVSDLGPSKGNLYFNYYATAAMQHADKDLRQKWNDAMRDSLKKSQATDEHVAGSWFGPGDHGADVGGRLYTTSLSTVIYSQVKE